MVYFITNVHKNFDKNERVDMQQVKIEILINIRKKYSKMKLKQRK